MMKFQDQSDWRILSVRMPRNIAALLEAEAVRNDRSLSSEVVQILRARLARLDNEPERAAG
jgi:hypothetical protein